MQRLVWAFQAYDRFIDSLSHAVREHLPKGDDQGEAYVVVFGKTQVGKTTLILDLMGVSSDSLERVSKVLRGGREPGESATATAMEYRCSPDTHWHFSDGMATISESGQYDDTRMREKLGGVRRQMFARRLFTENPLIVWIPSDCINKKKDTGLSVRMLDLPGAHADNSVEREHVLQMAKNYVPNADLILLVGSVDDLSFLNPTSLILPGIEDWQIVPDRFRIVTTYSFTAQSVREVAMATKTVDADFFRTRLREQLQTHIKLNEDASDTKRFFPLEIGDSWINADRNLIEKLEPVILDLKEKLLGDIKNSASQIARLRNAVGVYMTVPRIKENNLKKMNEELTDVSRQRDESNVDVINAENKCKEVQMQIDNDECFRSALRPDDLRNKIINGIKFNAQDFLSEVDNLKTNTSHFSRLIYKFTSEIKCHFFSKRPACLNETDKKFWNSLRPSLEKYAEKIEQLVDSEFTSLRTRFSAYVFNEYFPGISDDFSDDKNKMRECMHNSVRIVQGFFENLWVDLAGNRLKELSNDLDIKKANQYNLQRAKSDFQCELNRRNSEVERIKKEISDFEEKMKNDEENSKKFVSLFEKAYLDELNKRYQRIVHSHNSVHAFLELMGAQQLIDDHSKILK